LDECTTAQQAGTAHDIDANELPTLNASPAETIHRFLRPARHCNEQSGMWDAQRPWQNSTPRENSQQVARAIPG